VPFTRHFCLLCRLLGALLDQRHESCINYQ
jgi:hypothetical protein